MLTKIISDPWLFWELFENYRKHFFNINLGLFLFSSFLMPIFLACKTFSSKLIETLSIICSCNQASQVLPLMFKTCSLSWALFLHNLQISLSLLWISFNTVYLNNIPSSVSKRSRTSHIFFDDLPICVSLSMTIL